MAKEKTYRINSLPGIKACIDYMRSAKSGNVKQEPKAENKKSKY